MARLCERPACSAPAAATYGFDPVSLIVTLDQLRPDSRVVRGVLCQRHADALRPPRGWVVLDQRDDVPQLFRVAGDVGPIPEPTEADLRDHQGSESQRPGVAVADPSRPRRRPARAHDSTEELALFESPAAVPDDPEPAVAEVSDTAATDPTLGLPWSPSFDRSDDLDGQLAARSPLLLRAFGVVGDPDAADELSPPR
jgi:hypothetical protein